MSASNKNSRNSHNPWRPNQTSSKKPDAKSDFSRSETKFKEAQKKLQAAVQKHVKEYESSSEDEDLETDNIIGSILNSYTQTGGSKGNLNKTQAFLEETFLAGTITCLICISSVKRTEQIWNCWECYCVFHLMCIQRWSKDTVTQKKQNLEDQVVARPTTRIFWGCPKCRHEYNPSDIPTKYECFCGKATNPQFQPYLIPHSCGETCGKNLKPLCGHGCVLLCHPGSCPPCPKTVMVTCFCSSQPPRLQRCSNKEWSCGSPCNKALSCQKHKCAQPCHSGECPPCPKKSIQKCVCGASNKLRPCSSPVWQCDKICSRPLECGFHSCMEVCHEEKCEPCLLSKPRKCPCGKTSYSLPCTEETPTCGDTCGKVLECGVHPCNQRCHKDKCGNCLETVTKQCRCGLHTKEVQCCKPYLCESKCKQIKDCNKHPCNRKCCDGNCPPCEKPCGRTLSCGNHKCSSICHRGPCYPCSLTETVACKCGGTTISVPCGRKQKTRPPKCNKPCLQLPDCHHDKREPHHCHFGDCPPCRQKCSKDRPTCSHRCPAACHSAVLVKIEAQKATMPWEQSTPQLELQTLPCPDCVVPVAMACLGNHEISNWPCHIAKVTSCGRSCGRLLDCGNHSCPLQCHLVENAPDEKKAGTSCRKCESGCTKPRPEGCSHTCPRPCHPGECPPCKQMLRIRCHCGLNQPYVSCKDWTSLDNKEELQSCGNQCPKNYACGHRCRSNCHSGACPNPEQCKKKVKIACGCKRIRKEFPCEAVRCDAARVACDEACLQKQAEEKRQKELEDEQRRKDEELRNLRELEKYEKKFQGKKKSKERRLVHQPEKKSALQKYWLVFSVAAALLAFCVYYVFLV